MELEEQIEYRIQDIREWYDILFKALNNDIDNLQAESCYFPIAKTIRKKIKYLEQLFERYLHQT